MLCPLISKKINNFLHVGGRYHAVMDIVAFRPWAIFIQYWDRRHLVATLSISPILLVIMRDSLAGTLNADRCLKSYYFPVTHLAERPLTMSENVRTLDIQNKYHFVSFAPAFWPNTFPILRREPQKCVFKDLFHCHANRRMAGRALPILLLVWHL